MADLTSNACRSVSAYVEIQLREHGSAQLMMKESRRFGQRLTRQDDQLLTIVAHASTEKFIMPEDRGRQSDVNAVNVILTRRNIASLTWQLEMMREI